MKKALATLLTVSVLFVMGGWTSTRNNGTETDVSLIGYLETHEVDSYGEFIRVLETISSEPIDEEEDIGDVTSFSIDIDYDNMIVSVLTMSAASNNRTTATNTASKSYYTDSGIKIFTISVTGTFSYSTGSCTTTSASGSYKKAFLSLWNSTPTISSGNITTKKAYARISGTATSGSNSISYSLTLTCNDSGTFSSY